MKVIFGGICMINVFVLIIKHIIKGVPLIQWQVRPYQGRYLALLKVILFYVHDNKYLLTSSLSIGIEHMYPQGGSSDQVQIRPCQGSSTHDGTVYSSHFFLLAHTQKLITFDPKVHILLTQLQVRLCQGTNLDFVMLIYIINVYKL